MIQFDGKTMGPDPTPTRPWTRLHPSCADPTDQGPTRPAAPPAHTAGGSLFLSAESVPCETQARFPEPGQSSAYVRKRKAERSGFRTEVAPNGEVQEVPKPTVTSILQALEHTEPLPFDPSESERIVHALEPSWPRFARPILRVSYCLEAPGSHDGTPSRTPRGSTWGHRDRGGQGI